MAAVELHKGAEALVAPGQVLVPVLVQVLVRVLVRALVQALEAEAATRRGRAEPRPGTRHLQPAVTASAAPACSNESDRRAW